MGRTVDRASLNIREGLPDTEFPLPEEVCGTARLVAEAGSHTLGHDDLLLGEDVVGGGAGLRQR